MFDADLTYDPLDMLPMLQQLEPESVVVGNRLSHSLAQDAMSPVNWIEIIFLPGRLLSFTVLRYMMFAADIGFDRKALMRMNLNSMDFEIEAEMYAQCAISGISLTNIPISYGARIGEAKLGSLRDGSSI